MKSYRIVYKRVSERVIQRGHSIAKKIIKRRYFRGIENLMKVYKDKCDYCIIVDNSGDTPKTIARIKNNSLQSVTVYSEEEWKQLKKYE